MKITNSRAVHTVYIGHKTNATVDNYTVIARKEWNTYQCNGCEETSKIQQ